MASKAKTQWIPAIYARLSKEDKDKSKRQNKENSLSIDNQIDIMKEYIKEQGWQAPKDSQIFKDDDKTGTNFNRKGFQDMYTEAEKGNFNVIVINDVSRFGRNWGESGDYFNKLEKLGIRVIFRSEGIDTADTVNPIFQMLPFYFIFADWYSKSTSEKIRAVNKKNAEKGQYRATYAPYGFQKDPNDRHKLIVDPVSSAVVKRIYEMRLQKYSYGAIVTTLNNEGVPSPSAYSVEVTGKTNILSKQGKWTKDSLNVMFQNPVYMGDTANGRRQTVSYKNPKQVKVDKEDWIVVKDTHPAIISREDWQKCNDMIKTLGRVRRIKESQMLPFTGLLKCRDCGYIMRHNHSYYTLKSGEKKRHDNYDCTLFRTSNKSACLSHYISQKDLMTVICSDIRRIAGEIVQDENAARKRFNALKSQVGGTQLKQDTAALKKVDKRLEQLDKLIQAAFEKSVLGGSSADTFERLNREYESEKFELLEVKKRLTANIEQHGQTKNDVEVFIKLTKEYVNITDIDRAAAAELIERIEIPAKTNTDEPREIIIYYNFIGNY
jgi:DNA invertase Pin-like site-specific DNA recombinase